MKKDLRITLRVNKRLKERLQKAGYSMQQIFDDGIAKLVDIQEEKILLKKFATREGISHEKREE